MSSALTADNHIYSYTIACYWTTPHTIWTQICQHLSFFLSISIFIFSSLYRRFLHLANSLCNKLRRAHKDNRRSSRFQREAQIWDMRAGQTKVPCRPGLWPNFLSMHCLCDGRKSQFAKSIFWLKPTSW